MRLSPLIRVTWLFALCASYAAKLPELLPLTGDIQGIHDPVVIKEKDTWYLFSTGVAKPGHLPVHRSTDLHSWTASGHVFDALPNWATREIPGADTIWAPDISHVNGVYRLYYAISTFGHNDSVIGLATNKTLDPASPAYHWSDEGLVIRSHSGQDDWNALDPNLVIDEQGRQWLLLGSYWSGIKMRRIDNRSGKLSSEDTTLYSLAARPRGPGKPGAIEAPFALHHGQYYYLFVSFDFCCRGVNSNYYIVVGRSRSLEGPYVDAAGKPMLEGGGTVVVEGTTLWRGPGHQAVLPGKPDDLLFFHAYDGTTGRQFLKISTLAWDDGWPHAASLPGVGSALEEADSLLRKGSVSDADTVVREYLEKNPTSAQARYMLGFILFTQGKPEASLTEYTVAAKYRKPDAHQLKIVGLNYALLDDFIDADKWLTASVQQDPRDAQAWYHLGRTKYNENRFKEAVEAFNRCLTIEPSNPKAEDNLGLSYEGLGQNDDAIAAYRKAVEWDRGVAGKEAGPYINLGTLLVETGRITEGIPFLVEAIARAPKELKPRRELGKAYLRLNQLDQAVQELEAAIRIAPENAPLHFILGQAYRKKGWEPKASSEFDRYRALNQAH